MFFALSNFRAMTRLETFAMQAILAQFLIHFYNSLHLRNRSILSGWGSSSISTTGNRELKQQRRRRQ